ncbi:excisionase [Glutamicibacter arilaitensis]|uniref:Excisionase n=1 Tax=Glutamicibacter arilaitensis TaxID=256701 RepID=A0A2N7S1K8_9MICC|nr:excisionase [Glutamicibacter arilaitensis]
MLAVTGTILLALGAFWLSFTTLRDLAVLSGVPAEQAWIWPLIVDGVILEATISVVALRNSAPAARRFAWLLLAAGAGVSVAANITHAVVAADTRVPALIAALVASVPPLVLLAMTHLTVELTRNSTPATPQNQQPQSPSPLPDAVEDPRPLPGQHSSKMTASESLTLPERKTAGPVAVPRAATKSAASGSREDARAQALVMHADGVSKRQIATELGVHPTTVGRWLNAPTRRQDGESHD